MMSWGKISGIIKAHIDPITGEFRYYWKGGAIIGLSRDFLFSCDREFVAFEGDMPKVGDKVQIGVFETRAFRWDSNLLLCVREKFDTEIDDEEDPIPA